MAAYRAAGFYHRGASQGRKNRCHRPCKYHSATILRVASWSMHTRQGAEWPSPPAQARQQRLTYLLYDRRLDHRDLSQKRNLLPKDTNIVILRPIVTPFSKSRNFVRDLSNDRNIVIFRKIGTLFKKSVDKRIPSINRRPASQVLVDGGLVRGGVFGRTPRGWILLVGYPAICTPPDQSGRLSGKNESEPNRQCKYHSAATRWRSSATRPEGRVGT